MTKEKESWLEKLIELLNEYEKEMKDGSKWDILLATVVEQLRCLVISKSYWFIQWLVENEKIEENSDLITLASELWCAFSPDVLLMYLAIQDNPIEFLVSILK